MARNKDSVTRTFTDDSGVRHYVSGKDEKEAQRKMAKLEEKIRRGEVVVSSKMPLDAWADKCIETYKVRQGTRTHYNYKNRYKNAIGQYIGKLPLSKIKPIDCQKCINQRIGYSQYEINQTHQIMNFLFNKAVDNKLISVNPAAGITRPSGSKTSRRSLTRYERDHFEKVFQANPEKYMLYMIMLKTGCRPDEACELQGRDIRLMEGRLMLHIRGTKTSNSDRLVPLDRKLYEMLCTKGPYELLCPNQHGKRATASSRKRLWENFKHDMNLSMGARIDPSTKEYIGVVPFPDDLVAYCFRHTYCTDLQKAGIDIRTAQALMGHADIQMTANIYTHADEEILISAADKLGAVFEVPDTAVSSSK